jgi:effector-binding domain-containing protein
MKAIKYIFILILIFIVGGAIFFSLKNGKYTVTQSIVIEAPAPVVYQQIEDFKSWQNWNMQFKENNETSTVLGSQTKGVDAFYKFTDADGEGKISTTGIEENKFMHLERTYKQWFASSTSQESISLLTVEYGTQVTWQMNGEFGLVEKAYNSIFNNKMTVKIDEQYQQGLKNLDQVVIESMNVHTTNVDGIIETGGGYFLYMSTSAKRENFQDLRSQMLQNINSYMERGKIENYGLPRIIYENRDPSADYLFFSVAVPVQNKEITEIDSNVLYSYQEPGKAVKITLNGAYRHLQEARDKGEEFILKNGLIKSVAPPYEIYKTNPKKTPNPADYRTEIYIPIQ